jgi:hypothetical protein
MKTKNNNNNNNTNKKEKKNLIIQTAGHKVNIVASAHSINQCGFMDGVSVIGNCGQQGLLNEAPSRMRMCG